MKIQKKRKKEKRFRLTTTKCNERKCDVTDDLKILLTK